MSELAKRWAVALVGVPAVLGLLYAGGWVLAVPLALLAALGARELHDLARSGGLHPFDPLGLAASAGVVLIAAARPAPGEATPWLVTLLVALAGLGLLAAVFRRSAETRPLASVAVTCLTPLYVGVPLACVPLLHALPERLGWAGAPGTRWAGAFVVALPLASAWVGDAVAYFAGRAWGERRLAPAISPKKTWVGAWAGLASSAAAGALWLAVVGWGLPGMSLGFGAAAAAGGLLGASAQLGDLVESLLKREAGVKDSGTLFPGHGGVLDRLDALALSLPLAYGLLLLEGVRP